MRNLIILLLLAFVPLRAQEQIDKADSKGRASALTGALGLRVRVARCEPEQKTVRIVWRRGGEGLGGSVVRGEFLSAQEQQSVQLGAWTAWLPLKEIVGNARGWEFPSIVVNSEPVGPAGRNQKPGPPLTGLVVEFEFAENGRTIRQFVEAAPKGATVGFAFPGGFAGDKVTAEFTAQLNGLSDHARLRRERLEKAFPSPASMPKLFGIIGHVGGYGEGPPGKGGGSGFGTRHCNPAIVANELHTLRMLGVNGMVDSIRFADAAGMGADFRHTFWGGPGSGDPMAFFQKPGKAVEMPEGCPFDPALKPYVMERTAKAIAEHKEVGAKDSWALWDDEMGVYAKDHIARCDRCAVVFRNYLKAHNIAPGDVGAVSWDEVKPYPVWQTVVPGASKQARGTGFAPAPADARDSLRYYYTYRLMSHANGQVFTEAAQRFQQAGIRLYAMQGPTPSWNGSSLDWHEFYDLKPNTAFVFETSNRDARTWQWESYLADIGRGIAHRHEMAMGCLIKPHRGAPLQRMLGVVARGTRVFEWYTFGPDYSKGDSFSQSPELLEQCARAARFLGEAEPWLYGAEFASRPEVAFVTPRSAEIWSRVTDLSLTTFENAKWVYLALRHSHVPVDILSERQLAEGNLAQYKVLYIPGTHLRRDAGAAVIEWVKSGGTLWTDAGGLSRDEANQPALAMNAALGLSDRAVENWGSVEQYRATELKPLSDTNAPAGADFAWEKAALHASVGREPLKPRDAEVLAKFGDGQVAMTRHRLGKGEAIVAGLWSGISYSAKVRRGDFDMRADFDPNLRALIAAPAIARTTRAVVPADPLVEAVSLVRDGRRSVALMNWSYHRPATATIKGELQPVRNLRIALHGHGAPKSVRSIVHGSLPISESTVTLPSLAEIDLLVIE